MTYVRYIDKTREYYREQGYDKPYQWAHHDDVPFTRPSKPLAQSRVALISTSEIAVRGEAHDAGDTNMGLLGGVYSIASNTSEDALFSPSHSYDQHATSLDDVN
ncbi:MAG: reductase, partial [Pseudomonadota bacterium]